jgi:hypothetical protein
MRKAKAIYWIIGLLLAGGAVYWAYLKLVPEETRIAWLLDGMEKSFNSSRAGATLDGLGEEFREETAGLSRSDVHQVLVYIFLNERDPKTKELRFRVKLGRPAVSLQPLEEGKPPRAEVKVDATFLELRGKDLQPAWEVSLEASLEKSREGWKVLRSRHRSLAGKRPF